MKLKNKDAKYYWAYGSNLNVEAMKRRCPRARKVGPLLLTKSRLVFRGVADVEFDPEETCPGGLWKISPDCEKALDIYEGVSGGLYEKVYVKVRFIKTNRVANVLLYQMRNDGIMPPCESYLDTIVQGYKDFGLDLAYLDMALARSWNDKEKTPFLRRRYLRRGSQPLARLVEAT